MWISYVHSVRTLRILYRGMLFLMKEGKATTLHKKTKQHSVILYVVHKGFKVNVRTLGLSDG